MLPPTFKRGLSTRGQGVGLTKWKLVKGMEGREARFSIREMIYRFGK